MNAFDIFAEIVTIDAKVIIKVEEQKTMSEKLSRFLSWNKNTCVFISEDSGLKTYKKMNIYLIFQTCILQSLYM